MNKIPQHPDYSINDTGTVIINDSTGKTLKISDQLMNKKPTGYKYVTLRCYPYAWKRTAVHRLVAFAYIPNPLNLPEINHKDSDKSNNSIHNLEWCTHQQNIQHSWNNGRKRYKGAEHWLTGKKTSLSTRLKQSEAKQGAKHHTFKGYYIVFDVPYGSSYEASRATGICQKKIWRECKKGIPQSNYWFQSTTQE